MTRATQTGSTTAAGGNAAAGQAVFAASPAEAEFLRRALEFRREAEAAGVAAAHGQIFDRLETAVVAGGRRLLRGALEELVQQRIDALEKKTLPCDGPAAAGRPRARAAGRAGC